MKWGIEFEYMLIDTGPSSAGRVRDFGNIVFQRLQEVVADKPGRSDPAMVVGDLGIRNGYWYLEGDERFDESGQFRKLEVKGIEVRTPPRSSVRAACAELLEIETQLFNTLSRHYLGLAIVGFNPNRTSYEFVPPLNAWERELRRKDRGYDGSLVSTLSYGPDINVSSDCWSMPQLLDHARKLTWYSPYIVPFSFSSPFLGGKPWDGFSVRTHRRAPVRPAVRCFCKPELQASLAHESSLVCPARIPGEEGRLEFKAFDAVPCIERLRACCNLLHGICLDRTLDRRTEAPNLELYERASRWAFDDPEIFDGAERVIKAAKAALSREGLRDATASLEILEAALWKKRTPAHALLAAFKETGRAYKPGGLRLSPASVRCHSPSA